MPLNTALKSADFERVLANRPCARSEWFALHHAAARPSGAELSTGEAQDQGDSVDKLPGQAICPQPLMRVLPRRLGLVIPKRMARRAVTRNLIKRKAREAWAQLANELPAGDWVLRLRAPVSREQFPSAVSQALRVRVGAELSTVFQAARRAAKRLADAGPERLSEGAADGRSVHQSGGPAAGPVVRR